MKNQVEMGKANSEMTEVPQVPSVAGPVLENVAVQPENSQIFPINEEALKSYSPEEQEEILRFSNEIDFKSTDRILNYGSKVLQATFKQCGDFLKAERGSTADQEVIKQVVELSKKANENYEDFNLIIREPNFFQKIFLSLFSKAKDERDTKIRQGAITNYNLLLEIATSFESWLVMLKKSMEDISISAIEDSQNVELLEKYILAGKIAQKRIEFEIERKRQEYEQTGLHKDKEEYEELQEGKQLFDLKLTNLERSRVMYYLSIGQLKLTQRSNKNVQISIHTQKDNSMALMAQQLRNAVLNQKNRDVMEAQKSITRLNDELIKSVSKTIGITAEDTERLIYAGSFNIEAAKEAVQTVINSCNNIEKVASEMLPKINSDMEELSKMLDDIKTYVENEPRPVKTLETTKNTSSTINDVNELTF